MKTELQEPPQVNISQVGNVEVITLGDSEEEEENELNVSQVVSKTGKDHEEALSHAPPHNLDRSSRSKQKKRVKWRDGEPGGTLMLVNKKGEDDSFTKVRPPSNVAKRVPL